MIELLNVDIKNSNMLENIQSINRRRIISNIINLSYKYKYTKIKTNYNIISRIQDTSSYSISPIQQCKTIDENDLILYGKIYVIDIYLDVNMVYDDNRIIPIYDHTQIRLNKINKIRGNNTFDMLEYLKIENLEI